MASNELKILILDPDNMASRLCGSYKGVNFKICGEPHESSERKERSLYTLKKDERGEKCRVFYQGGLVAEIPVRIPHFERGLKAKIFKIEMDKGSATQKIVLPELQRCEDGSLKTNLNQESRFLDSMIKWRLQSIKLKEESTNQAVLKILLSSSESGIAVSPELMQSWTLVINDCVKNNQPVTLSMSLAIGTRIPNRLKYFDDVNLPTFGWMYFFFFIRLLHEKVKLVYPPGIKMVIFDEAWLFGRYLGISRDIIEVNLKAVQRIIDLMDVPVEIILMQEEHFDLAEVNQIEPRVSLSQVYGFLCSLPEMNNPAVMHHLYRRRKRNYTKIQMAAGALWEEAQKKCGQVAQYLAWRKKTNLFGRLISGNYIDTTITDKDERLVLDITCSLMNHGMPVTRYNNNGMLKVDIVPEYRIPGEYESVAPVWIQKADFGIDMEGSFKFYYIET